jgi:hypothetical protein
MGANLEIQSFRSFRSSLHFSPVAILVRLFDPFCMRGAHIMVFAHDLAPAFGAGILKARVMCCLSRRGLQAALRGGDA